MSILLHDELVARLNQTPISGSIVITPLLDIKQVGSGSIDLRLGTEFLRIRRNSEGAIDPFAGGDDATRDPRDPVATASGDAAKEEKIVVPLGGEFVLHPGEFVLGSTLEFIGLPSDMSAQVLSRSSWGRLGLLVATAVVVHPFFRGVLTLELVNVGNVPIKLRPGLRVAQIVVWRSSRAAMPPASGADTNMKYGAALGPRSNRLAWEQPERNRLLNVAATLGH